MRGRRSTQEVRDGLRGEELARVVSRYLAVPFRDRGRGWDGADCWGLVRLFYREELGVELPSHAEGYATAHEPGAVGRLVAGQLAEGPWRRVEGAPEFGDVAVAWTAEESVLGHVGLYLGAGLVLNARPEAGLPRAEEIGRGWWADHLEGFWRYQGSQEPASLLLLPARAGGGPGPEPIAPPGGSWAAGPGAAGEAVYATLLLHPLTARTSSFAFPQGVSLEEIVVGLGLQPGVVPLVLRFDRREIEPALWSRIRPKAGQIVSIAPAVSDPITIAAFIAAAAQAVASAAAGVGIGVAGAFGATGVAGSIATTAGAGAFAGGFGAIANAGVIVGGLIGKAVIYGAISYGLQQLTKSIASPSGTSGPEPATSPSASRVGFGENEQRRYQPIPFSYGRVRRVPDEAAVPFTEVSGRERFVRRVLMVGDGRYRVSELKVDGRPIEELDGALWHVVEGGLATSYAAEILDSEPDNDAPVHWWRLNGNGNDAMSPALNLTASGIAWVPGLVINDADQAAELAQPADSIGTTAGPATTLTDNFTVEALLQIDPADQSAEVCLFHNGNLSGSGYGVFIYKETGGGATKPRRLRVRFPGASTASFDLTNVPTVVGELAGQLVVHHIALRRRNGRTELFLDGARYNVSDDVAPVTPAGAFGVGVARSGAAWVNPLVGKVDEVAVYETALTDDEIYWHWYLATIGLGSGATRGGAVRWYNSIVREIASNVNFPTPNSEETDLLPEFHEVTFSERVDEINFVWELPGGVYRLSENGSKRSGDQHGVDVRVEIRIREESEPDWTVVVDRVYGPMYERKAFLESAHVQLPGSSPAKPDPRYKVQFRARFDQKPDGSPLNIANPSFRTGAHDTSVAVADVNFWYVQGITHGQTPIAFEGACAISVRLPYETNGTVSCLSERMIPVYDPSDPDADPVTGFTPERVELRASQCALDSLRNAHQNPDPYPDDEIALSEFLELYESAEDPEVGLVVDYQSTTDGVANQLLSLAFASLDDPDGTIGLVREQRTLTPVGLVSPRNTRSFRGTITWEELPHANLVRWTDEEHDDDRREMVVYRDGYNAKGTDGKLPAETFGVMELLGLRKKEQVKKHARFKQALLTQRNEKWEVDGYLDTLPLRRGQRVEFTHPAAAIGYRLAVDGNTNRIVGFGQMLVTSLETSGGNVTAILFEQPVTYEAGKNYAITYRRVHDSLAQVVISTLTVNNLSGSTPRINRAVLTTPEPIATAPEVGNVLAFGEVNLVTVPAVVHSILYHPGFTATVALVPYVPGAWVVYDDPDANAPPRDLGISNPGSILRRAPRPPRVLGISSDERYLTIGGNGQAEPHIAVTFEAVSGDSVATDAVQARYRLVLPGGGFAPWFVSAVVPPTSSPLLLGPVTENEIYEIQLRGAAASNFGAWSVAVTHKVTGRLTPPPPVQDLRIEPGRLRWEYPNRPLDLVGFLVRWSFGNTAGLSWEEAQPAHIGVVTSNEFPTETIPTDETITIMVKAVDQLGVQSLTPAFVVVNIGGAPRNVILDIDHRALGWPGTRVNFTVPGGGQLLAGLQPASDASPMWLLDAAGTAARDAARMWNKDDAVPMWAAGFGFDSQESTYTYTFLPDAGLVGDRIMLPTVRVPQDAAGNLRYRPRGPSPAWQLNDEAPAWTLNPASAAWAGPGEWLPISAFVLAKRQPYEVELTLMPRRRVIAEGCEISQHHLKSDVDDAREHLEDVVIPRGGVRLPITGSYAEIKQVVPTLQRGSGNAVGIRVVDYSVDGPLVQAVDATGGSTTAIGDFEILAVPRGSSVRLL